jgi:DNA ligase (NAD+)
VVWRTEVRAPVTVPDQQTHDALSCWQAGPGCEEQFRARLVWLGGKQGLQLEGLGADTWQALIDAGRIHHLLDWLDLTAAQLAQVPGIGKARADALAQTFADARQRPFGQWLHALGMPTSGDATLPDWATVRTRSADDWHVGASRADRLADFFSDPDVQEQAKRLHEARVAGF